MKKIDEDTRLGIFGLVAIGLFALMVVYATYLANTLG